MMVEPKTLERARRKPSPASLIGILGEVLVTIGLLVLLYLGWQLWLNDLIFGATQQDAAAALSEEWAENWAENVEPTAAPTPTATGEAEQGADEPVVMAVPAVNKAFATLIVPALGADYRRPIAEGVSTKVLNNARLGMGHYPQTQLPGEFGNFALASHRSAYGGAFHDIHQLAVGDSIFVETPDGWYKYVFRGLEYVRASGIGVILPVPQSVGAAPEERLITLTTCNPFFSSAERIIGYGAYDSWYPRAAGAPSEIAAVG
jgi:sortase A